MPLKLGIDASIGSPGEDSLSEEEAGDGMLAMDGRHAHTHTLSDDMELLLMRSGREVIANGTGSSPPATRPPVTSQAASRDQIKPVNETAQEEAAKSKRDARTWEAKYQALKNNRQASESEQLKSMQSAIMRHEEEKAAAAQKISSLESQILQETHRAGMLQVQLSSVSNRRSDADKRMQSGPLMDKIREIDDACTCLEQTMASLTHRGGLARIRGVSPDKEKLVVQEQMMQLRQQCIAANALAESRAKFGDQRQKLLDSAQEQRRLLLTRMSELEAAREADAVKIGTLHTERSALVEAINRLKSDATLKLGEGALTLQAVIPALDSIFDTADALEKTLQDIRGGVEQCVTENLVRKTSERHLNGMLDELQSSFEEAQDVARDHTVRAMSSDLASMAQELERRQRLVVMLEDQLRTTHEHAVSVEKDRASLQQKMMMMSLARDVQDSQTVLAKQELLERALIDTTQQLAHAQQLMAKEREQHSARSASDLQVTTRLEGMDKEVQTLEHVVSESTQGEQAASHVKASQRPPAEQETISTLEGLVQSLMEDKARLEGENLKIEDYATRAAHDMQVLTEALTEAENGLREVQARNRRTAMSSESDQLWEEVRTLTTQASERTSHTQMLKDEIARLEGVVRREQLDNTRKQHRIDSLEQQLEDALMRSREQAAAERERSGWIEERESDVQSELLREVTKHKRALAEMDGLASAKEDLERDNLRISKTLNTVKRSLLDLVEGQQHGSNQALGGAEIRARIFSILGGLSSLHH